MELHSAKQPAGSKLAGVVTNVPVVFGSQHQLLRRGLWLEYATLGWNVVGVVVLAIAALMAGSIALAGFGLDSLIEIGASTVVIWQLSGTAADRERLAMRLIGAAFIALAIYIAAQAIYVVVSGGRPVASPLGILWTGVTCVAMLRLERLARRTKGCER
jgi:divalent metal cation (Fe/Co/Zn/Cd) transporter